MRKVFQTSVGGNRKITQKRVRMIIFVRHFPSALIKNADLLMQIGEELSENYGVPYLPSDF